MPESLFQYNCRPQARNFIQKETLAQVFSCEFCEIFKNIFFTEHLWNTEQFDRQKSEYVWVSISMQKLK